MIVFRRASIARMVIPFFFVWSILAPYREAHAFVAPPGVIPPLAFVPASGPNPIAIAIGSLAVGMVVGYVLVGAVLGDDSTDAVRIQLADNSTGVPSSPYAPATTTPTYHEAGPSLFTFSGGMTGASADIASACTNLGGEYNATYYRCHPPTGSTCEIWGYCIAGFGYSNYGTIAQPAGYTCPAGYTLSGSACNLSDARQVVSDKKQDVLSAGSGANRSFVIPSDVDTPSVVDGSKIAPILRGDGTNTKTAYVYGHDSSGRQVLIEVALSPDGTQTYVRHYTQDDSTGQSQILKTSVSLDAATGTVTQVQHDVQVGAISAPGAATVAQVSTATPSATTSPQVTTTTANPVSNSAQPQSQVVFPTDYARTGEAASAAQTITPKLDTLHHDLTDSAPAPSDPALPDVGTYTDFGSTFDGLKGWSLPGHTSQCPTGSFNALGSTYTIDAHCSLINTYWSTLQSAMTVVWTIIALFLVLSS